MSDIIYPVELSYFFHFPNVMCARIQEADIDATVALINRAYKYQDAYTGEPRINSEKLRQRVEKSRFYVVKEKDIIIGCVSIKPKGDALHLGLLTVDETHRGKGVAPALMEAIERYASEQRFSSLQLDYMSISPWLKKYYEKFGFCETGEVERWGRIDLIRMRKNLIE